ALVLVHGFHGRVDHGDISHDHARRAGGGVARRSWRLGGGRRTSGRRRGGGRLGPGHGRAEGESQTNGQRGTGAGSHGEPPVDGELQATTSCGSSSDRT